jgi:hypothetical protein
MRIFLALVGPIVAAGCIGASGPNLPTNVGSNHPSTGRSQDVETAPEPPGTPVPVGTDVWANYHDSGFYFHGVVAERRGADEMHRVIYDDGANEWLPANSLLPDSLGEEAHVHIRPRFEAEFQSAVVERRLGRALYVRLANGDERWTVLPHVRFQAGDHGIPRRGDAPRPPVGATAPQVGADVLVDYQLQGLRFPATVTAQRDDGQLHVIYLDGETEWTAPALVTPDALAPSSVVHVRRAWQPANWVRAHIRERLGSAMRVEFDDGGTAWTSLFRLRAPVDQAAGVANGEGSIVIEPPAEPPAEEPRPRRRPRRRAQPSETQ